MMLIMVLLLLTQMLLLGCKNRRDNPGNHWDNSRHMDNLERGQTDVRGKEKVKTGSNVTHHQDRVDNF